MTDIIITRSGKNWNSIREWKAPLIHNLHGTLWYSISSSSLPTAKGSSRLIYVVADFLRDRDEIVLLIEGRFFMRIEAVVDIF
jgi:hypothetical protein